MSVLTPWIGGTRRLVMHAGQSGLLFGPVRRALVEPGAGVHDELLRLLLCHYGKQLWATGLIAGTCGNLSARLRDPDTIYITPRSANKARMSAPDIQRVNLTSSADDVAHVSVEFPMHRACYLTDREVGAVIHTHAPALTALGLLQLDLAELLPEAAASLGAITRVPYARSGSEELAEAVARVVADGARLLLLERHGAVALGHTLGEAYERMEFGELSAKTALIADAGGAGAVL